MKDHTRSILEKGRTINCSSKDEQEMLALFQRPEIEFEVKEILTEEISSDAFAVSSEPSEFTITLF